MSLLSHGSGVVPLRDSHKWPLSTIVGTCCARDRGTTTSTRHTLKFLRQIDRATPRGKTLHLIANNYDRRKSPWDDRRKSPWDDRRKSPWDATHKHPAVQDWLARHARFNMHFTPTSASWLNMVERFFRDITTGRLRQGVFASVPELVAAIDEYVAHHNTNPKPFIWTQSARDLLQKVIRANCRLSSRQNGTLR